MASGLLLLVPNAILLFLQRAFITYNTNKNYLHSKLNEFIDSTFSANVSYILAPEK